MNILIIIIIVFCSFISNYVFAYKTSEPLRVTLQSSLITLDPGVIQDSQSLLVSRQINCQLIRNEGSFFVLDAAESIKYITPLKIIVKLNEKAKFHDGSPVTSYDVLASLNYIIKSRSVFKSLFVWIKKIEIVDSKTLVFILNNQTPQFFKALSSTNYTIFKKEFLDKAIKNKDAWKNPLGCGGYKIVIFDKDKIQLNPIDKGLPILFSLYKKNQINASDLINFDIISLDITDFTKEINNFNIFENFDPLQFFIGLNSKSNLWKDKYARCDFLTKLNIDKILKLYNHTAVESTDLVPKGTLGYNFYSNYNTDLKNIAKNITSNNYTYSRPLCLNYLSVSLQQKYLPALEEMIKNIYPNIQTNEIMDVRKFGTNFVKNNCDVILFSLRSNYNDGYEYLTIFEDSNANFTGLNDKKLSQKILRSQNIPDSINRALEYKAITRFIGNHCIIRPLFTIPYKKIYIRKGLTTPGLGLVPLHQYYFGNISR